MSHSDVGYYEIMVSAFALGSKRFRMFHRTEDAGIKYKSMKTKHLVHRLPSLAELSQQCLQLENSANSTV